MSVKFTSKGLADGTDSTKELEFNVAGVTTGTTRTITVPDSDVDLGKMGKVLQVVSYFTATQGSQTLTSTDSIINGITKVITPLGANSKFLVTVRWFGETDSATDTPFNIHMNGVRVNINGQGRGYGLVMASQSYGAGADDSSTPETVNMTTLVSTSSVVGTAITFSLVADTYSSRTLWNNRCFGTTSTAYERGTSEIIITEIGA